MNIKDSYLHGGTHVVKNINFLIAASGTNQNKLVATITWAEEGSSDTELAIPISGATFGSLTKNTVFAAPNGSNGVPSFRTLVAADIPNISANKITSDTLGADRLPLATNSAKGAVILGVAKTSDADSAITGKKYWVKMNANGKLFVDIPWTDHTYTVNNATFSIKSKIGTNDAVTLSDFTANQSAADDFTLILGSNITFTNDTTNRTLTIAGTPNTTYKLTLNGTVKGTTGGTDLGTFYAIATSDTSTANQVWMRNSSNNGYGWRTLGSRAFDSTAYLPLTGGTMTGAITLKGLKAGELAENSDYNTAADGIWNTYSDGRTATISNTPTNTSQILFKFTSLSSASGTDIRTVYFVLDALGKAFLRGSREANSPWRTILHSGNSSVSLSGSTLSVKINGTTLSLTNTWRGIQNNLTSDSTTDSLSAAQGKALANGSARDNTKVLLDSGTAEQTIKSSASSLSNGVIQLWRGTSNGYAMIGFANGTTKTNLGLIGFSAANTLIFRNTSGTDYSIAHANNITDKAATITSSNTTLATIAGKNITAKLPTNAKDTAGIVAGPGAAGKVYISNSSGAPTWDTFDTTVTSGSSHLVTSGAVYTAIANNVASAVQYQGTITSEADMIALTSAGQGDFARVTTAFTFTDASGASVTAHVGDVVYLTNNTPGTAANWIVAHTEIDTNTWTAASTSAAGYVPKLVTGGANLAAASTDYVLAFTNGATSPSWLKLPANAYKNDNTTGVKLAAVSGTKKTDSTLIKIGSGTGLSIAGGTNKFSIGDGTNYIEVSVVHGLSTKNISINGTNYALYTSASSLPTIKAPTGFGTANLILATNADATGLTWVDKPATNVTTSLYVGASDGTNTAAQTAGNVHLILKEGSSYTRYNITGSGRASVTSDASGTITINSAGYSNFVKSGSTAAAGLVPSPGTTAGTSKFLCEDGTWKTPSYIADTVRPIYSGGTSRFTSSQKTAINFVGAGATSVSYEAAGTGDGQSGNASYANIKISSNNDLVKFSAITASTEYYLPVRVKNTTDTAQLLYRTSIIVKDSTITATLSGNATTATNLNKASGRGYLYLSANTTTAYTGVGSVTAVADIGIPYIGYASNANTYGIYKDLFYLSGSTKYIGNDIHSNKFACVKTKDSVTDDWTGSSTSGQQSGSGTTYSAGDGISINNGTISTTRKEWYGTESQFNSLSSLDSNTTYYIMTT